MVTALLAGCTGQEIWPETPEDLAAKGVIDPWSDATPPYRIGEGDKIRVQFPLTPEMNEDVTVRPDGKITLVSAGEVELSSLTTAAASQAVAGAALRRLKNPKVEIAVIDPASARIFIGGEVRAPGLYPVVGPVTLTGAMSLAGGALDTARLGEVIVLRRSPGGRPMMRLYNVRANLEGMDTQNMRLYQGDIVFVPKSHIAEMNLWIDQFINKMLPFNRNFDYTRGDTTTTSSLH